MLKRQYAGTTCDGLVANRADRHGAAIDALRQAGERSEFVPLLAPTRQQAPEPARQLLTFQFRMQRVDMISTRPARSESQQMCDGVFATQVVASDQFIQRWQGRGQLQTVEYRCADSRQERGTPAR